MIETTFTTETGRVRLTDAMAFAEGQRGHNLGYDAPHELLRGVEGIEEAWNWSWSSPRGPSSGFTVRSCACSTTASAPSAARRRWTAGRSARRGRRELDGRSAFTIEEGDSVGFALRWLPVEAQDPPKPTASADVAARIEDTAEAWRSWEAEHDVYQGSHWGSCDTRRVF